MIRYQRQTKTLPYLNFFTDHSPSQTNIKTPCSSILGRTPQTSRPTTPCSDCLHQSIEQSAATTISLHRTAQIKTTNFKWCPQNSIGCIRKITKTTQPKTRNFQHGHLSGFFSYASTPEFLFILQRQPAQHFIRNEPSISFLPRLNMQLADSFTILRHSATNMPSRLHHFFPRQANISSLSEAAPKNRWARTKPRPRVFYIFSAINGA